MRQWTFGYCMGPRPALRSPEPEPRTGSDGVVMDGWRKKAKRANVPPPTTLSYSGSEVRMRLR
eukprot:scaffold1170_cov174-Amphora_coffeaeformis.AAC.48